MSSGNSPFQKLKLRGIRPSKALGQNFLYDINIVEKIIEGENLEGKLVLEIGPGPGMLTEAILKKRPKKLIIIEKDKELVAFLKDILSTEYGEILEIYERDALQLKLQEFFTDEKIVIISNLPYNISVKLLSNWFEEIHLIEKMILMFQKEVGDRIIAQKSTKDYGSLSIISQWLCEVSHKFDLPPGAFYPSPKVFSSVLKFIPRVLPLFPAKKERLEGLCQSMFQMRRKMIRKSLQSIIGNVSEILKQLNIDETYRAEDLTIEEFCKLSFFIN
jgi:16S rRNA (adenine1518-N6/adenine1519-N6)-dimethyltransferase